MAPLSPASVSSLGPPSKRPRQGPGPSRAGPAKRRIGEHHGVMDRPTAHDTARRDHNALMRAATNLGTRRDDDDADTVDGEVRPRVSSHPQSGSELDR
jgi:hypothetical protein